MQINAIYPFQKLPKESETNRPFIPVMISNPSDKTKFVKTYGLLDTGADRCTFNKSIPEMIGYELKAINIPKSQSQGAGIGTVDMWIHPFIVHLLSPDWKTVFWKSQILMIPCVDHNSIPPLLGFNDFMCNFRIAFNHTSKRITIQSPI
jgi:hypothetical protein